MLAAVQNAMSRYWGYTAFLQLQQEAMTCIVQKRDSVVVLPTGGGKSLCFQAPAATLPGLAVVVSPLIALMKDQVDAMTACGVPAARLDSSLSQQHQPAGLRGAGSPQKRIRRDLLHPPKRRRSAARAP